MEPRPLHRGSQRTSPPRGLRPPAPLATRTRGPTGPPLQPRTLPGPTPRPQPARPPAYRHHFGSEPHRSGWPNSGPEPSGGAQGGAGDGGGELRVRPPQRRRTCCEAAAVGGGAARLSAQPSPRAGAPRSTGPDPRRAPSFGFCLLGARHGRTPSSAPKPTDPRARPPARPRRPRPPRGAPPTALPAGLGKERPRRRERARLRGPSRGAGRRARARGPGFGAGALFFLCRGQRAVGGARRNDSSARLLAEPGAWESAPREDLIVMKGKQGA